MGSVNFHYFLVFSRSSGTFSRVAPVQPIILQVNDRRRFLVDNIEFYIFFLPPGHVWGGATMMVQLHQHVVTVDLTLKCILQKAFLLFGLAP